ncbi:large ribosomal subunit protein uL10m-like [Augochlora pura]
MAQLIQKTFQLAPNQLLYQQKRFRGKINLKKPKIYFKNKVLNLLLQPFFADPKANAAVKDLCAAAITPKTYKLHPYEKILAKEARNWFEKSKMVAFLHTNSITNIDRFEVLVELRKHNMYYKTYYPRLIRAAMENSSCMEKMDPVMSKQTAFIFSPDINVTALEKILKKCPQMYSLGGILEGEVMNRDDFLKYGQMDIETAQLGLVQVLQNAGGVNLNRQLTHHQTTLVSRLKQIGTDGSDPKKSEESVPA